MPQPESEALVLSLAEIEVLLLTLPVISDGRPDCLKSLAVGCQVWPVQTEEWSDLAHLHRSEGDSVVPRDLAEGEPYVQCRLLLTSLMMLSECWIEKSTGIHVRLGLA